MTDQAKKEARQGANEGGGQPWAWAVLRLAGCGKQLTRDARCAIEVRLLADGRPMQGRLAGTRAHVVRLHLPPMSVGFLTYEETGSPALKAPQAD